jgi:site-specific DNA-methyltransferase (adenine-specific)
MNSLYFGDNLDILREHIKDESVDLVYLDPPFNSKRDYNLLFKAPDGHQSDAQITAFEDSWHWSEQAEREFSEILKSPRTDTAEMIQSLRRFLKENDMMAYLIMMANRLIELHRVLKNTGSIYLHCDPTASHYLKILLDAIFGKENFRNEIIWKRRYGTFSTVHESKKFGNCVDSIFYYAKKNHATFNPQYSFNEESYRKYVEQTFCHIDEQGRKFRIADLANPALRPNLIYEYKGYKPPKNGWAISREKMEQWDREGRLWFPKDINGRIQRKRFLDELKGKPVQNLWDDIEMISSQSSERLGYPTQKPLALLERIIQASSNEGDVVLDPFCGCGTAVHAAEKIKRQWIGIDITHLAVSLIEKRLRDAFPKIQFEVHGTPKDYDGAANLAKRDKYQFQWWACSLVNAQPYQGKKKGADSGIDGLIFFLDEGKQAKKIVVSVKGGENVSVAAVRDLRSVVDREKAAIGLLVTLNPPTKPMETEAISAGYTTLNFRNFRKIQILTIEKLLNGTEKADYPDMMRGELMFKKARAEKNCVDHDDLFSSEEGTKTN